MGLPAAIRFAVSKHSRMNAVQPSAAAASRQRRFMFLSTFYVLVARINIFLSIIHHWQASVATAIRAGDKGAATDGGVLTGTAASGVAEGAVCQPPSDALALCAPGAMVSGFGTPGAGGSPPSR